MPKLGPAVRRVGTFGVTMIRWAMSPAVIVAAMLIAATACTAVGVYLMFGQGWALIAVSAILFGLAGIMLRGLARG